MHYSHRHTIESDVETFWKLFFDPDFNRALYLEHLKFTTYRVLEDQLAPDGTRQRRIECVDDAPAQVALDRGDRLVGDRAAELGDRRHQLAGRG